jgi:hypothetical protein
MDKVSPSSFHRGRWLRRCLTSLFCIYPLSLGLCAIDLSHSEARSIGHKIWQNECNGTVAGLTSWNAGENFASLGIGHFIWYPEGANGPFDESFPKLVRFMQQRGTKTFSFLSGPCPWHSRADFLSAQQSTEMKQLRDLLAGTVDLQTQFLINRLDEALPKMLAQADGSEREKIRGNFQSLTRSPSGCYALIDYVNFKGEGTLATERYAGQGWGLLQVLERMPEGADNAPGQFSQAAAMVLRQRVKNAPPARHEDRWLSGWIRRVNGYSRP